MNSFTYCCTQDDVVVTCNLDYESLENKNLNYNNLDNGNLDYENIENRNLIYKNLDNGNLDYENLDNGLSRLRETFKREPWLSFMVVAISTTVSKRKFRQINSLIL